MRPFDDCLFEDVLEHLYCTRDVPQDLADEHLRWHAPLRFGTIGTLEERIPVALRVWARNLDFHCRSRLMLRNAETGNVYMCRRGVRAGENNLVVGPVAHSEEDLPWQRLPRTNVLYVES